jgi:hypothetical protein
VKRQQLSTFIAESGQVWIEGADTEWILRTRQSEIVAL